MRRWAANYQKLSPACRARLTGAPAAAAATAASTAAIIVAGQARRRIACTHPAWPLLLRQWAAACKLPAHAAALTPALLLLSSLPSAFFPTSGE